MILRRIDASVELAVSAISFSDKIDWNILSSRYLLGVRLSKIYPSSGGFHHEFGDTSHEATEFDLTSCLCPEVL